jgi:hypothetical protein
MIFLSEIKIENIVVKFWSGIDHDKITKHSKDGKDGFMIIFIDDVELERKRFQRNRKISKILGKEDLNFEEIIDNIDNKYISLYQSKGLENDLMDILIRKFKETYEYQSIQ